MTIATREFHRLTCNGCGCAYDIADALMAERAKRNTNKESARG